MITREQRERLAALLAIEMNKSVCARRRVGALAIDPETFAALVTGCNRGPRANELCGGETCLREAPGVPRGERWEVGCLHAELDVVCAAARRGIRLQGAWLACTLEPCLLCAKAIGEVGIAHVWLAREGWLGGAGQAYLADRRVGVELL